MDRALAAAAYMTTPKVRPTTNYPLELHYIRALLIQQNDRQCINACRDVLRVAKDDFETRPLQKTFVLFYLALAHDALARVMHPSSQTKLPAFNSAEHYFLEALRALPTIEQARVHYAQSFQKEAEAEETLSDRGSFPGFEPWDVNADSKSFQTLSSGHRASQHSYNGESIDPDDVTPPSDFNDLESNDSFHEILNDPALPRDFSCMSLLETAPLPHARPQPHGLMRPIRLGSPPKPYHPPQFHTHRLTLDTNVRPSRRVYANSNGLRPPPTLSTTSAVVVDQPSPVSPLNPADDRHSDTSTISPVSPATPPHTSPLPSPLPIPHPHHQHHHHQQTLPETGLDLLATRLEAHLCATRIQLETHIAMVQQAKQHLFRARANRSSVVPTPRTSVVASPTSPSEAAGASPSSSASSATPTPTSTSHARSSAPAKLRVSVTSNRSSLSSATAEVCRSPRDEEHALRAEKRVRIAEGRERKWMRVRFQPERYMDLAEGALAEL